MRRCCNRSRPPSVREPHSPAHRARQPRLPARTAPGSVRAAARAVECLYSCTLTVSCARLSSPPPRRPNTQVGIFLRCFDGQPDEGGRGMGRARPLHAQASLGPPLFIMSSLLAARICYIPTRRGSILWSSLQLCCVAGGCRGGSCDVPDGTEVVWGQRWADPYMEPRLCSNRLSYLVDRTYCSP